MPPQIKVLLSLFAVFIALFILVRNLLLPDSFGQFGHYRGEAIADIASAEPVHAGRKACIECHEDMNEMLQSDMHAGLSCLVCHGPGLEHVNSPEATNILKLGEREHCGSCHAVNPARPADVITQVDPATHHLERKNCIDCHNPHQVWDLKE